MAGRLRCPTHLKYLLETSIWSIEGGLKGLRKPLILWVRKGLEFNRPILIEGFPGLGYVGKITVDYLVEKLRAVEFARMYAPYFPQHVIVDGSGRAHLLKASFYCWKAAEKGGRSLILVSGDSQAQTIEGQYKLASVILGFSSKIGVRKVISVGGYESYVEEKPKVYVAGTDREVVNEAVRLGAQVGRIGTPIVGLAGVIIGIAKFYDMQGLALLAETPGFYPDVEAAKAAVEFLSRYLNLEIDTSDLEVYVKRLRETLEDFEEMIEEFRAARIEAKPVDRGRLSYIS